MMKNNYNNQIQFVNFMYTYLCNADGHKCEPNKKKKERKKKQNCRRLGATKSK